MSQERVQHARALIDLWNAGMREVPTEHFDPAVELQSPFSSVSGRPYRGHAGVLDWMRDVNDQFSEWQLREVDTREAGNAVVIIGTVHGRGRESGIEVEQRSATVLDFGADDRITRIRIYLQVDEALKAAGLQE